MNHTPEPWNYEKRLRLVNAERFDKHTLIAEIHSTTADGERIVACVNACQGINPEAVPDLLEACKAALPALNWSLVHQTGNIFQCTEVISGITAAIAKAKGTL